MLDGLRHIRSGKVRDLYGCDEGILLVASDRISAFDVILPTPVAGKGAVLTALSAYWFGTLRSASPNHLISTNVDDFPVAAKQHADALRGRTMFVRETEVIPIECVARGYLSGTGWKDYQATGAVCGIPLPDGLVESERLPEPIFTPAMKAEIGEHDENISFARAAEIVGGDVMEELRARTLALYTEAARRAEEVGIIIADTKFEFGLADGEILLIDEVLTPDSSRFWPASLYQEGAAVPSFDKQYVRDWLDASGWDHTPPGPPLPADVVANTRDKYIEAYERLSGHSFAGWVG